MKTIKPPNFGQRALCTQVEPELFFPESQAEWEASRDWISQICGACPLREPCLEYALAVKVSGIWAATNETERTALRKKRNIEPVGMINTYAGALQSQTAKAAELRRKKERDDNAISI